MIRSPLFYLLALASLLIISPDGAEGYRYLLMFTAPTKSHMLLAKGFVDALLERGHEVVSTQCFPKKDSKPVKGLTEIDFSHQDKLMQDIISSNPNILMEEEVAPAREREIIVELAMLALNNSQLQDILRDPEQKFDAVLVEYFYTTLMLGLAPMFGCPLVIFGPTFLSTEVTYLVDEFPNPAVTPLFFKSFQTPMSFTDRVWNTINFWKLGKTFKFDYLAEDKVIYEKIYGDVARARGIRLPDFEDVIHNASIVLVNGHPSLSAVTHLPPNCVEIGGFHVPENPAPLDENLKKIMDNSPHGVIYFSLGSTMEAKMLAKEIKASLLKTLSDRKETIIWKFEEDFPDKPNNVIIRSWMPQQSVLSHPNTKLFITHGGMLSTTEAIHAGIPLIGVPLFADQHSNMESAVAKGYAIKLQLEHLPHNLADTINEILGNKKYTEAAKNMSKIYHDRPMKPRDALTYWMEYAVRTGGAPHLRSPTLLVPWYQRLLLDILASAIVIVALVILLLRLLAKALFGKRNKKNKSD